MARKKDLGSLFVSLGLDDTNFAKALRRNERELKKTGKQFEAISKSIATNVLLPLAAVGGASVKQFATFDDAMTKSLSIMGDLSDGMKKQLRDTALDVSDDVRFSSEQMAESYFFLASAGLDAQQSIAALPAVTEFATAGAFDLATATDLATDAQSALGLSSKDAGENLTNLTKVTDVLIKANKIANASAEQFSTSLTTKAGPAMKELGVDIEEGVAVLGAFATQGIKAQEGGTALAIVLRDLTTKALKNSEQFDRMGISVFDATGKFNNIADIIGDMETALDGMSDAQRKATLLQLGFTDKSVGFISALRGSSAQIKEYEKQLRAAGGTTKEVAEKQLTSLAAKFDIVKGQVENTAIVIGEQLAPEVSEILDLVSDWAKELREIDPLVIKNAVEIGKYALEIAALSFVLGRGLKLLGSLRGLLLTLGTPAGAFGVAAVGAITFREEIEQLTNKIHDNTKGMLGLIGVYDTRRFKDAFNRLKEIVGGSTQKSSAPVFMEGLNKIIERTKEFERVSQTLDVGNIFDSAITSANNLSSSVEEVKATVEEIPDKVPGLPKDLKEIEKRAKEAAEAFKDLKSELAGITFDRAFTSLEDNIATAIESGSNVGLESYNQQLKDLTRQSLIDAHKSAGGELTSQAIKVIDDIVEIETQERIKAQEGDIYEKRKQVEIELANESGKVWGDVLHAVFNDANFDFTEALKSGLSEVAEQFGAALELSGLSFGDLLSDILNSDDLLGSITDLFGKGGDFEKVLEKGSQQLQAIALQNGIKQLSQIGDNKRDTIQGGLTGIGGAVGGIFGGEAGAAIGSLLGSGLGDAIGGTFSNGDAGAESRKGIEGFLEDSLNTNIVFGDRGRFEQDWSATFASVAGEGQGAFEAIGLAVQEMSGVTTDEAAKIGFILAENLSGNLDYARLLTRELGLDSESLGEAFLEAGLKGTASWREVSDALGQVNNLTGEGLVGVGDLRGAFDRLLISAGRGSAAINAVKDIAIEAGEAGADSLAELETKLIENGQFTEDEISKLMASLEKNGINSLDELESATTQTLGSIVADLDRLGLEWGNVSEEAAKTIETFSELERTLAGIPDTLDIKVRVNYETSGNPPPGLDVTDTEITPFAKGGVVNAPTVFPFAKGVGLMGEAGPEAIMPLKRNSKGQLGVLTENNQSGMTINVDARGATPGVEQKIVAAIEAARPYIVRDSVKATSDLINRGAF